MTDQLYVLVDYDNLVDFKGSRDIDSLLRHVESKIPDSFLEGILRIDFRLYGGWTSGQHLTPNAQRLSAEIQRNFPSSTERATPDGNATKRIVSADFARSGLFLPFEHLADTFVSNRTLRNVKIDQDGWRPCGAPSNCPLFCFERLVQTGSCDEPSCGVEFKRLLKQNEQKQVDTLIVADMAELAFRRNAKNIVIVSSDADMWPGILLCLSVGVTILHIHTTPGGTTKPSMLRNLSRVLGTYTNVSV